MTHPSPATSPSQPLLSQHAQKTTRTVGLLRAGTLLSSALTLASTGYLLAGSFNTPAPAPTLLWALITLGLIGATLCAYTEITHGVHHARLEEKDLRERLLRTFFTQHLTNPGTPPARHIALLTDSVERVTEYRQIYWGATIASIITPMLILVYALALDWVTGLLILLLLPLVPTLIWLFFRFFRKVSGNSRAKREALSVSYLDALRQLTPIRLLGAGPRIEQDLRAKGEENRRAIMKLLASNQLVIIVMDAVFLLFLICWSVLIISWRATSGHLTHSQALSLALLLPCLLGPLAQVAGFFYIGMGGRASQRVLNRVLSGQGLGSGHPGGHPGTASKRPGSKTGHPGKRPGSKTGHPGKRPQKATDNTAANAALNTTAAISVRNLSHNYGRGPVLTNLNFDIPHGARVALLGPSGTGKSTLLSLLQGTLTLQEGAIAVNGQKFSQLTPTQAPLTSASVAQKTWLFTGSIEDNLRLANPTASTQELWDALHRANLAHDIHTMPHGLATNVGEAGSNLSGGQAQRLSLARALLSQRKILLLDEPTAHIDTESETQLIKALAATSPDTTLLMATHRTALLQLADTILTLTPTGLTITTAEGQHEHTN